MNPFLISLYYSLWSIVCATLPIHVVLNGIIVYRIVKAKGWWEVTSPRRYFNALRADPALSRFMTGWIIVSLIEICFLLAFTVMLFSVR